MARLGTHAWSLLGSLALLPSVAHAQGFALDRFDPSERGSEWFQTESLDFRKRPTIVGAAGGFVFAGQYRPLALYNPDGSLATEVVRNVFTMHTGGSAVFFERVRLGLNLPLALHQDGRAGNVNGVAVPPPGSPTAGDLRIGLDGRIYGEHLQPFTVALGARLYLPTGKREDYTSDGVVRVEPRVMAAGTIKAFVYSARIGFQYRDLSGDFGGGKLGSEFDFGAGVGLRLAKDRLVIGPEIFGSTVVTESGAAFSRRSTPLEALLGAHYTLPTSIGDLRFGAGVGTGLTRGFGAPLVRYMFNIEWMMSVPSDRDGDGVLDKDDACPDQFGVHTDDPRTNGCPQMPAPPPRSDKDGDLIFDDEDACPLVIGVRSDDPLLNGCPPDKDKDGIPDVEDACPDKPGPRTDDKKTNGCPPDRDKDGIPDTEDACPDVPGEPSTDKRFNGCPPDKDNDGIPNTVDACPDHPGAPDTDPKKNGCPKAYVQDKAIKIRDQVKFKLNSAEILPGKDSEEVLQAVLKIFKDHPEFKKVRIEGHTDSTGPAELNRNLSAARAQSVVNWLVKHGVDKNILASAGFGPDMPIDTNDTEEGRRNNRRVEFHIVEENK